MCNYTQIDDIYEKFIEYKIEGLFDIKPFDRVPEKEMDFALSDIKSTIEQFDLKNIPDNAMSKFIIENFPQLWR